MSDIKEGISLTDFQSGQWKTSNVDSWNPCVAQGRKVRML